MHVLESLVLDYGQSIDELFRDIVDPDPSKLTEESFERAIEWLIERTDRPWLALEVGAKVGPQDLGTIGKLLSSSRNLEETLNIHRKYHELLNPWVEVDYSIEGSVIKSYFWRTNGKPASKTSAETTLGLMQAWGERLLGEELPLREVRFRHAKPEYADKYHEIFKAEVKFNCDEDCLLHDLASIKKQMASSSPVYFARVLDKVESEFKDISELPNKISFLIRNRLPEDTSMKDVADALHCSDRTLQRRLADEDINFKDLKRQVRYQESIRLLQSSSLTIEQIAFQLGYSQRSSFASAFVEWSGLSPGAWRDQYNANKSSQ